jgi:AI-2 transport protein TqsA
MNNTEARPVLYAVGLAAIFIILFGIRASAYIINPILLAMVITITVLPIPSRLTKRGMPGWLALVVSILMVVLLLVLVIGTVFFSVTKLTTSLPTYMASASQQASADAAATGSTATTVQIDQVVTTIGPIAQGLLASIGGLLVTFGLALVIFFFMISAALAMPTPSRMGLDPSNQVFSRIGALTEDVRKYLTVLTGINFLVGLGNTVFLLFLGVDYAVLWGLLAWFMG